MAKKIFAVTNIKGSNAVVAVGEEVSQDAFGKDELKSLYDAGAIEVRDVDEPAMGPDTTVVDPETPNGEGEEPKNGE